MPKPTKRPTKPNLGTVVIVALQEEFGHLFHDSKLRRKKAMPARLGVWYELELEPGVKVNVTFIGRMGSAESIAFTTKLLENYRADVIVNIGVSGSFNHDVKLGDVVCASLTDLFAEAGAIEEVEGKTVLRPSGIPLRTEDFKALVDNLPFEHKIEHADWVRACAGRRKKILGGRENAVPPGLLGKEVKVLTGHLACAGEVVKSAVWKQGILQRDRKYLAIDMESAAIAFAADEARGAGCKLLVVRGISDFADARKDQIDAVGLDDGNAIRQWALGNALGVVKMVLKASARGGGRRVPLINDVVHRLNAKCEPHLDHKTLQLYKRNPGTVLADYEILFNLLLDGETPFEGFHTKLESLESMTQGNSELAVVGGYPGTGKSSLLTCFYLTQLERYQKGESRMLPICVNIRNLLPEDQADPPSEQEVVENFARLFKELVFGAAHEAHSDSLLLIVDGCDSYLRHPMQSILDGELRRQLAAVHEHCKTVKLVGAGIRDSSPASALAADMLQWADKETMLHLGRVRSDSPKLPAVIDAYTKVNAGEGAAPLVKQIRELIVKCRTAEVDLFVLSLLTMAIRRHWHQKEAGIGSLYFDYCIEQVNASAPGTLSESITKQVLKKLAKSVFDIYARRVGLTYKDYYVPGVPDNLVRQVLAVIPHLHSSLREFLIAEHAVELLLSGVVAEDISDSVIYPYGINRFVRAIINRSTESQVEAIHSIRLILDQGPPIKQKTHLAYVLGRFSDTGCCRVAISILNELRRTFPKSLPEMQERVLEGPGEEEGRRMLLLHRTIYISLIYLGNETAAEEYLKILLSYPVCDNLNRGFHLQYYEDQSLPPPADDMIGFDDVRIVPRNTFEVLAEKLEGDVRSGRKRAMTFVELHTICSLCINRHVAGVLPSDIRQRLLKLVQETLARQFTDLTKAFTAFLHQTLDMLKKGQVSIGSIFSELHALKRQKRAGWTTPRTTEDGVTYHRQCKDPESVADHTWGCLLIADAFLPEISPDDEGYDKLTILRTLLIHDLPETYTGDIPSFLKTSDDLVKEERAMGKIVSLSALAEFRGIAGWRTIWTQFKELSTINARIAADIDALEGYLQMLRYHWDDDAVVEDAQSWAEGVSSRLYTVQGRRIFKNLRHEGADSLSWFKETSRDSKPTR